MCVFLAVVLTVAVMVVVVVVVTVVILLCYSCFKHQTVLVGEVFDY